jgi:hypothetical protein
MGSAYLMSQLFTCQSCLVDNRPICYVLNDVNGRYRILYRFENFKCEIHKGSTKTAFANKDPKTLQICPQLT